MRVFGRAGVVVLAAAFFACGAVLGLTDPRVDDGVDGGADAPAAPPDAATDAPAEAADAGDAAPFCSTLDAAPTFCDDFDEQPTLRSWWAAAAQSHYVDASIRVVPAAFASPPSAMRVDLVSIDGDAAVDSNYWVRWIHPGPVTKSIAFSATVVVDDIAAVPGGDAGIATPDARLVSFGDARYSVEINLTSSSPPGTLTLDLAESYGADGGYNAHDYTFSIGLTRGAAHAILVRMDVATNAIVVELDGFIGTRDDPTRPFVIPAAGLVDVHLDLGTKTDRPNTHATMRYDDVVLDLR